MSLLAPRTEFDSRVGAPEFDGVHYPTSSEASAPLSDQREGNQVQNSRGAYARKFRGDPRKMFLGNTEVAALCSKTLRVAYDGEQSVHKAIADDTGKSPAAAENWTAGDNPMSLVAFVNAYRNNPRFKAHARKILLMEEDSDPDFQAELATFIQAVQRRVPAAEDGE